MKRQRTDTFNGNDNKRFLPMIESFSNTQFEDLPNEVIYDIFGFLDFYHAYQGFYNLNTRFQSYFLESNVPRKINLFLMPKTTFNRYNEDIILSNRQRIHTLRISNYFMFEKKSFSFSYQTSLRTLIIENIRSTDVKIILRQLTSLSNLTSLSISTLNAIRNINSFYEQIFRLSTLKYLKLLVGRKYPKFISPITINKHTSIEHLIFNHGMDLNELIALLSSTPCLRHLSAMLWHKTNFELKSPCNIMTNLTYMSLRLCSNIPFDDLQKIFINHCPFVEVLHISTYERNINYANEWKRLMSLSLPNLRVFNIQFLVYFTTQPPQKNDIEQKMKLFNSSFWTERQWLFEYEISMTIDNFKIIIYSTKSFGRTKYKICDESHGVIDINHLKSVDHIKISSKKAINQYMYDFPHATKLTLGHTLSITSSAMIINEIIGILRLKQIEVLAIEYAYLCPVIMCELLDFMPNIHTLTFHSMSFKENNTLSIEQNDIFRSISKRNLIKNVTFREYCTLYKLKLILKLFPRLQCIRLDSKLEHIQLILEYLSDNNHLILVCFLGASRCYIGRINKLIKAGSLSYNFKTAHDDRNRIVYVWW